MGIPEYNPVPLTPSHSVFNEHSHHHHYQSEISLKPLTPPSTFQGLENGTSTFKHESASHVAGGRLYDDQKLKHRIRILKIFYRVATTTLALTTATQEGRTLFNYVATHDTLRSTPLSPTPRGPWAKDTQLWSSILLFSISVLTSILGIGSLIAYVISGIKKANEISKIASKIQIAVVVGHVGIWVGVAIAYRVAKNGKDLWGWACSPFAEQIQPDFEGVVDFKDVCERSGKNWGLTIASVVVQLFSVLILVLAFLRMRSKRLVEAAGEPMR